MKTLINQHTIIRGDLESLPDNIIGVAVFVSDNNIGHAGIFIRYNDTNHLLHFDSEAVLLNEIPNSAPVFFKQLSFIPQALILSTFHWFTKLTVKRPAYGYFYSGSFYDETTLNFTDPNQMPEIMSCVGFCLNVLKTVLRKRNFMEYTEWYYHDGLSDDQVLKYLKKAKDNYPEIDLEEYLRHVRRILPLEYFTAGFDSNIPVKKAFTDANKRSVERMVLDKVAP